MRPGATPSSAFDSIAAGYDAAFTHTQLGQWMRDTVRAHLLKLIRPGDWVLELGCGTGEDAVWLASQGVHVMATDASPAMLDIARRKVAAAHVGALVSVEPLDLNCAPDPGRKLDGVLSNFGALNCIPDRRPLGRALGGWVRPGGWAALVVMGPFCPWEIAWHVLHGRLPSAFRRLRGGIAAHTGSGATQRVWYPSPRRLRSELEPFFRPREAVGIGVALPPTYLRHVVEQRPALFRRLAAWESRRNTRLPWTWLNDHYMIAFERREDISWAS